jgi:periplasmic protein CpxP/Spy
MKNKSKIWIGLIVALLTVNLGLLIWPMIFRVGNDSVPIDKELGFDAAQSEAFTKLRVQSQFEMDSLRKVIDFNKKKLFEGLQSNTINAEEAKNISQTIGLAIGESDYRLFMHFSKVKALCNPEQKLIFEKVIVKVTHNQRPPKQEGNLPPPPPPGERRPE